MENKEELNVETEEAVELNVKDNDECKINNDKEPINKKQKLFKDEDDIFKIDDDEADEVLLNIDHEIPEEGFIYPLELDASDMLDETEFDGHFPSVTERYFTPYYQIDVQRPGDDICIRIHSNRICMISLAPSHTIFQENKTIKSCNYKVSDKLDRTQNKVSGKSKHGAQPLQSNSNLCCLTCDDGSSYTIKCCMVGKLVEVNERLIENPELLKEEPHFGGYIAIVLPNLKHLEKTREKLLNEELYQEAIKKRNENKEEIKVKSEEMDIHETETVDLKNVKSNEILNNEEIANVATADKINDDTNSISDEKKEESVVKMEVMES